jgi:hypothetical protein
MTQHDKIIEMCMDRDWHCQAEFWKNHIFSPHKRRDDVEKKTDKNGNKLYEFFERPCEHGIAQSKDFCEEAGSLGCGQSFQVDKELINGLNTPNVQRLRQSQ